MGEKCPRMVRWAAERQGEQSGLQIQKTGYGSPMVALVCQEIK